MSGNSKVKQSTVQSQQLDDANSDGLLISELSIKQSGSNADVVSGVSIELAPGKILGVVGESGSGKSTLGLGMLGYLRRGLTWSEGSAHVAGKDMFSLNEPERAKIRGRDIAYVPQDPVAALNPARRIGTQLLEMLTAHGNAGLLADGPQATAIAACESVGLQDAPTVMLKYPHQLSGGQNQRVCIAMALMCNPSVIVLDEPTTGLDVSTQRHLLNTISTLSAEHSVAMVYISHDIAVVSEIADDVAVVYSGRIVEFGSCREVFEAPHHPYTRALLDAVPSVTSSRSLRGIDGSPPQPAHRPEGCVFAPRCPHAGPACVVSEPELRSVDGGSSLVRCVLDELPEVIQRVDVATTSKPVPAEAAERVLTVSTLEARYQGTAVVHRVDLELGQGECLAIVGESGSGKTTLARCMAGIGAEWSGTVTLSGEPLAEKARHRSAGQLRDMQYVFQNPFGSLNPRLSVGQSLRRSLIRFGTAQEKARAEDLIAASLRDVSLPPEYASLRPSQLSGGERQRVAIARALITKPSVLLCDEITSALDVSIQAVIVSLLKRLQQAHGLSMIFITHNIALVSGLADRVAVMESGRIVETGMTKDVFENPTDAYTKSLLSNVPRASFGD